MPTTAGLNFAAKANRTGLTSELDLNRGNKTYGVFAGSTWMDFKRDWFAGVKYEWHF